MTRREFEENVFSFGDLIDFCTDNDFGEYVEDVFDEESFVDEIWAEINGWNDSWMSLRDWLDNLPCNCEYYIEKYGEWTDADYHFEEYKSSVLEVATEHGVWDIQYALQDEVIIPKRVDDPVILQLLEGVE